MRETIAPAPREIWFNVPPCDITGAYIDDTTFNFLNVAANLNSVYDRLDWTAKSQSRLWQYNLHYFDYLREPQRPDENIELLIQSWIDCNIQGSHPGWEPFTTSLRIVNWIFYLARRSSADIPKPWLTSLYTQALWLERNDEKHILANHYFENLKALFFAGCFFKGKDADRWLARTLVEIPLQVKEQTLADGGHYERSPQYHCLMLENYLDIYNLCQSSDIAFRDEFIDSIRTAAHDSLTWLARTICPDGRIPLFNDSAFGTAPSATDLFAYANRLSMHVDAAISQTVELIECPYTGLYGCRSKSDFFLVDCGEIGPEYQPGHSHCDFLSYELMLNSQRIVVDTGVHDYDPGSIRHYVRSTEAHNTISVDRGEQSEIWGEFRVARRAQKLKAHISLNDGYVDFGGSYRGFYEVRGRIEHQRRVQILLSEDGERIRQLSIADAVLGKGFHSVESYIHLHPEVFVKPYPGRIDLFVESRQVGSIQFAEATPCQIRPAVYCPEFGLKIRSRVIVLCAEGALPLSLDYRLLAN